MRFKGQVVEMITNQESRIRHKLGHLKHTYVYVFYAHIHGDKPKDGKTNFSFEKCQTEIYENDERKRHRNETKKVFDEMKTRE